MSDHSGKIFEAIFEHSPVGLVLVNFDTSLRDVNSYMFTAFEMQPEDIQGKMFGNIFHCALAEANAAICGTLDNCRHCQLRGAIEQALQTGQAIPDAMVEHEFIVRGQKQVKWFKVSSARVDTDEDIFAVVSFVDITLQKNYEKLLNYQLSLDLPTGSSNKHALFEALEALGAGQDDFSIAMIDFDDFKIVNDTRGHVVGDKVLKLFSQIAIALTRRHDMVSRYGGEEFTLVFPQSTPTQIMPVIQRIAATFCQRCLDDLGFEVTFSAGLAGFTAKEAAGLYPDEMIAIADRRLYKSKADGKNRLTSASQSILFEPVH